MKQQILNFIIRWALNCLGLYVAAKVLDLVSYQNDLKVLIIGGLILSFLNALIKPLLIVLTLPAIALTLGFFMIIINGFVVFLASKIYVPLQIDSFWQSILVGIIIGLVNYTVTIASEAIDKRHA
jgi:putative membrane protein